MKRGIIIQARFSSRRLPGKVLQPLLGKPLLGWLIERMQAVPEADRVIVATSDAADDRAVADYARRCSAAVHRGPLDDVLRRFREAAEEFALDVAVRVSGDSPLLDPALVSEALSLCETGVDLVSNVTERTFPKGQSVEAISVAALRRVDAGAGTPDEREHVTPYLYAHPQAFRIRSFRSASPAPGVRLCVDTPEDFAIVTRMASAMTRPQRQYGVDELVALYRKVTQDMESGKVDEAKPGTKR